MLSKCIPKQEKKLIYVYKGICMLIWTLWTCRPHEINKGTTIFYPEVFDDCIIQRHEKCKKIGKFNKEELVPYLGEIEEHLSRLWKQLQLRPWLIQLRWASDCDKELRNWGKVFEEAQLQSDLQVFLRGSQWLR